MLFSFQDRKSVTAFGEGGHSGDAAPPQLYAGKPVHRHPSTMQLFVKELHTRTELYAPHRAKKLARLVISRSPARIQGFVMQRLARISGDLERCPVCPQECPVAVNKLPSLCAPEVGARGWANQNLEKAVTF